MSISTFTGIETALRAVLAQQQALNVTGHNIANASTAGYTRQSTQMQASTALQVAPGMLMGTGVDVVSYQRVRDQFLDVQLRAQTMLQGSANATSDGLGQVEGVINEPSDMGLNSLLGQYWSAWQNVANSPEDVATRQSLVEAARSLATGLNSAAQQLTTIKTQTATNVGLTMQEINADGADLATLNTAIFNAKAVGNVPNDLLDRRDQVLDKLSQIGNVGVTDLGDGTIKVTFDNVTLVSGQTAQTLSESGGTISNTLATPETATPAATTGKLGALIALRDTVIPGYGTKLDTIASTLIKQTNAYQAGGVDASGVTQTGGYDLTGAAGTAFFSGTNAATIAVATTAAKVAAATVTGKPGDNTNALRMAAMANDTTLTPLAGTTINGAYSQLVTSIGSDAQTATRAASNAKVLVDQLTSRRESVSGVSLDEEMTNLIRYQQGYQAAARALTAMDDALTLLISRTGRAGL